MVSPGDLGKPAEIRRSPAEFASTEKNQRSDIGLERRDFCVCRKLFTGKLLRRNRHTSADVTTTCGIAVFVGVLARCRIVEKNLSRMRADVG